MIRDLASPVPGKRAVFLTPRPNLVANESGRGKKGWSWQNRVGGVFGWV